MSNDKSGGNLKKMDLYVTEFYCPYLGRLVPAECGTPEHVVPLALGGTNDLCVQVESTANKELGTTVDAPMIDVYAHRRVDFDLRGHSGREPEFKLDVAVNGSPGTWEMRLDGGGVRLKPRVTRTTLPNGDLSVSISGEPAEARRIAANFREAHESKGRHVAFVETVTVMEQPEISGTFNYDPVALGRFQAKLALGLGHWLWGDPWSRGAGASRLRRSLWSTTIDELNANAPASGVMSPEDIRIKTQDHEHLFVAAPQPDDSMALALFLFGQPGYVLTVAEPGEPPNGDMMAVVLDVTTRRVRRLTLHDMLAEDRLDIQRRDRGA